MNALIACGDGIGNIIQATPLIQAAASYFLGGVDVYLYEADRQAHQILKGMEGPIGLVSNKPDAFKGRKYSIGFKTFCANRPEGAIVNRWVHGRHPHTDGLPESRSEFNMLGTLTTDMRIPDPYCHADLSRKIPGSVKPRAIALCAGSKNKPGPFGKAKRYGKWGLVVAEIIEQLKDVVSVQVMGTPTDDTISPEYTPHLYDWRGKVSLEKQAGVIARCDLALANDCGLAHVAAAVGTPTVVAYGPSTVRKNLPPKNAVAVSLDGPAMTTVPMLDALDCMPCIYRKDGAHERCAHECMDFLDPLAVAKKALELLPAGTA